jgi:hypothetical protein
VTRRLAPLLAFLLALAPELARACAVCGAAADEDQSRLAYLATTIGMSVLPLALFGGFLLWLRAKHRRQQRDLPMYGAVGRGSPEPK